MDGFLYYNSENAQVKSSPRYVGPQLVRFGNIDPVIPCQLNPSSMDEFLRTCVPNFLVRLLSAAVSNAQL
jgi:hypothetical protein